jgi:hypothetical protein
MSTAVHHVRPKHVNFQIGKTFDSAGFTPPTTQSPLIAIVKREGLPVPRTVLGLVENYGDVDLTLEIDESSNNNTANLPGLPSSADAYADRAIRVDGSAVSGGTITVKPGGKVVFVIETTATSDLYWRFQTATATPNAFGRVTLSCFEGDLRLVQMHQTGP